MNWQEPFPRLRPKVFLPITGTVALKISKENEDSAVDFHLIRLSST